MGEAELQAWAPRTLLRHGSLARGIRRGAAIIASLSKEQARRVLVKAQRVDQTAPGKRTGELSLRAEDLSPVDREEHATREERRMEGKAR